MADRKNTPWDSMAERVAELLKHQLNKSGNQTQQPEALDGALEILIALQQKTNEQIQQLTAVTEAQTQAFRDWRESTRRSATTTFLRKMALEIPPVVIAVLLAFGINSWWQQRRADINAEKAYRNIVSEIKGNLNSMQGIIHSEEKGLGFLEDQIQQVSIGNIDLNKNYGASFNTLPLRDAAWQTAILSNVLSNFEDTLIMDLTWIYETAKSQEEFKQLTLTINPIQKFSEQTLLPYLKVNASLLDDHIGLTKTTAEFHRRFLEKYGELEAEGERDE
ncbi:MAG: hypothetical protein AAF944_07080 [Bacteroidota bacterium]